MPPRTSLALQRANRAIKVAIGGAERYAAVEDAARLRDAIGVPLPMGVPLAFIEPVADPLGDLVSRYARTHGPFTAAGSRRPAGTWRRRRRHRAEAARRGRPRGGGRVPAPHRARRPAHGRHGRRRCRAVAPPAQLQQLEPLRPGPLRRHPRPRIRCHRRLSEWCDAEVLRKLRRRSLAALRAEVEPVDAAAYGRFLPAWQNVRRPVPARAAGAARAGRDRHRRRPALRRADSGLRLGTAGPRQPGVELPAGHAGRAHGSRRGALVRRRLAPRQRRLGQPASGRLAPN